MTVYAVAQFKVHDRARYDTYAARFMAVFEKFKGKLLAADFAPQVLEGAWDYDRLVLMSFPDKASFFDWAGSADYRAIATDRVASAKGVVLLTEGLS